MGQTIVVDTEVVGSAVIFSTDRSITGQDGASYSSAADADVDERFPGRLAARLFELEGSLESVFVASNQVVVSGGGGWSDSRVESLRRVIAEFFLFYRES